MSPSETSDQEGFLEHPLEALEYFSKNGVTRVVCEEKHMGSRAVVIVCKSSEVARRRFGVQGDDIGIIYTRTGRRFFDPQDGLETQLLDRLRTVLEQAGFWEEFQTDWVCLDAELMPWSVKAQELLRQQYAAVGSAAVSSLTAAVEVLGTAAGRGLDVKSLLDSHSLRRDSALRFVDAYRQYCWPVQSIRDLKLAPFHILATEGKAHVDRNHVWHMETLAAICMKDPEVLRATAFKVISLAAEESRKEAIDWWLAMTGQGGEGMVVKPLDFAVVGKRGLIQPAVKCRGREYLRIIYGPEYTQAENLVRLRQRGLSTKRSLALREFALGIEGLERFVRKEPLRRIHECAFGFLALESEPVDPRL